MKRRYKKSSKRREMEMVCFSYACELYRSENNMPPKEKKAFLRKVIASISKKTKFSLRVVRASLRNEIAEYQERRKQLDEIFGD